MYLTKAEILILIMFTTALVSFLCGFPTVYLLTVLTGMGLLFIQRKVNAKNGRTFGKRGKNND